MKAYTVNQLKAEFARLGYVWSDTFNLIGIRSAADAPNKFDDTFILYRKIGEIPDIYTFPNTTNPGTTYLQRLLNPKGAAVLKPGQYVNAWSFGLHRGKYEALCQVRPVTVWRDKDKDLKSEVGPEDRGLFGINIHKAATGISALINGNSAGCQVFQRSADFDFVMKLCKASGIKQFTYTLLNEF